MKVQVVGFGHMGKAIVDGLLKSKAVAPSDLTVVVRPGAKEPRVPQGVNVTPSVDACDITFICVRRKDLRSVCEQLKSYADSIVISVAVGAEFRELRSLLSEEQRLYRLAANLPVAVTQGQMALAIDAPSQEVDLQVRQCLEPLGQLTVVGEEKLNAMTALFAVGVGMIGEVAASLVKAAATLGLEDRESERLVSAMYAGYGALQQASYASAEKFVASVARPGGTTESALQVMRAADLDETIVSAVREAHRRAEQLDTDRLP